jgi:hypothetical protein
MVIGLAVPGKTPGLPPDELTHAVAPESQRAVFPVEKGRFDLVDAQWQVIWAMADLRKTALTSRQPPTGQRLAGRGQACARHRTGWHGPPGQLHAHLPAAGCVDPQRRYLTPGVSKVFEGCLDVGLKQPRVSQRLGVHQCQLDQKQLGFLRADRVNGGSERVVDLFQAGKRQDW